MTKRERPHRGSVTYARTYRQHKKCDSILEHITSLTSSANRICKHECVSCLITSDQIQEHELCHWHSEYQGLSWLTKQLMQCSMKCLDTAQHLNALETYISPDTEDW